MKILLGFIVIMCIFVGCSNTKSINKNDVDTSKEVEINTSEYTKAEFVKYNVNYEPTDLTIVGNKVYIEGKITSLDLKGQVFDTYPNATISQYESRDSSSIGVGIYAIKGSKLRNIKIKENDEVKVYGIIDPEKITSMPTILVDYIEITN